MRRRLAILLGVLGGGGGYFPVIVNTLSDDFSSALAAGAVNGTLATDGVNVRAVTDPTLKASISVANGFETNGINGAGDPGLWYPSQTRAVGLAVGWRVFVQSGTPTNAWGWDNNNAGNVGEGFYFNGTSLRVVYGSGGQQRRVLDDTIANNVTYDIIVIELAIGTVHIIKRFGLFINAFINRSGSANLMPAVAPFAGGGALVYHRKVRTAVLPSYNSAFAGATQYKAVSVNGDTIAASSGDGIVEHTITAATGITQELRFRRSGPNDYVLVRMDQAGGTIKVYEKVAGVETEKTGGTTTQTWTNGVSYRIQVSLYGSNVRVTVDATGKNDATSSFNASATGVEVTHAGVDLAAYPINPEGNQLADLNAFFP